MLALTRRVGEEIVIGDPRNPLGVIRIVEIHGDKVRLSFNFPKETPINRKEVAELKAKGLNATNGASSHGPSSPTSPTPSGNGGPHTAAINANPNASTSGNGGKPTP